MKSDPLAEYLSDCRSRHKTGALTPETSLYQPLETLLSAVGAALKPKVRCFMNMKNQGSGMPDGGLFTPDQYDKDAADAPDGQKPARGVIECKKPKDEVSHTLESEQVSQYWSEYQLVLVTNYRDFALLGTGRDRFPQIVEFYTLADTEEKFWTRPAAEIAAEHGVAFRDFLGRCLRHAAPLKEPKDVAWFLASYAREAKARIARIGTVPALETVQAALESALGLSFVQRDEFKGRAFFRSTLVQTLFYGIFSAWVLWHRSNPRPQDKFNWETASRYINVPVLRKLFRELSDPVNLADWRLDEVLEWAAGVLNRVDRADFFAKFKETEAVQYFYEPFLEQFDPDLRKELGVWYTPPEIVRYMVGRVDSLLKTELGRPDGLADESVYVLDPCCGTGAFLVEVLRRIDAALAESGAGALRAAKLKAAAKERVFGFELLPAPFVIAHLQLGLLLADAGAPLEARGRGERAAVYLTNALTGWDPRRDEKKTLFEELDTERESARAIKRGKPILVVLGNPPYNGFAGIAIDEEKSLTDNYRASATTPPDLKPQGQGLNDLYTRFFGMAEACILRRAAAEGSSASSRTTPGWTVSRSP